MTNEERDLISRFIARVGGAPQSQGTGGFLTGGSVPATQPQLPPIDREADGFISQQFQQFPEARYRVTQMAVVTEAALAEAQNRVKRLEWELEQTRAAAQQALQQQAAATAQPEQKSGGFFSGMFGGGQPQRPQGAPMGAPMGAPQGNPWGGQQQAGYPQQQGYQPTTPPPQPQYAPGYQPGMFQRGGSGFLGSALTTAAGVAGGMVVGNALMNAFSGHGGSGGGSSWGGSATNASSGAFDSAGVIPSDPTAGGFGTQASFSDPFGGGGAAKDPAYDAPQSSWDQGGGFDDANSGGGGFDGGGGGFDDNA